MATIEFNIFRKIKETEFLNLSWKRRDGNAKHIKKLVNRSNRVGEPGTLHTLSDFLPG